MPTDEPMTPARARRARRLHKPELSRGYCPHCLRSPILHDIELVDGLCTECAAEWEKENPTCP